MSKTTIYSHWCAPCSFSWSTRYECDHCPLCKEESEGEFDVEWEDDDDSQP